MGQQALETSTGRVWMTPAWTASEIRTGMDALLERFSDVLPADRGAHIVLKPNLNNDLVALSGNCTDLRVLSSLIDGLQGLGYARITIADGSNVGVDRRGIDTFGRLRVDALAERAGVETVNLNTQPGRTISLCGGAKPRIAAIVESADFLISVPTIKTHVEAGLSCAMKNWVGIVVGQDKRQMHYALNQNIQALNAVVKPDLVVVDGIVGMEGNGPGDGEPVRLGFLVGATHAALCDVAVARMVGLELDRIPYLGHALDEGVVSDADVQDVARAFSVVRSVKPAPDRPTLAKVSEDPRLAWLKKAVRPLTDRSVVAEAAYRLGVIQDVYNLEDDAVSGVRRKPGDCGPCTACQDVCPTGLTVDEIGVKIDMPDCIGCLYCWWVCPDDVIQIEGTVGAMHRQVDRYKKAIEKL
jgi:uncharacterized protein (DUF362 family)/ferredoxin